MVTLCWAAKGGSGTTVVAAALALASDRHSLLVDLAGEMPTVLGLTEPERPGALDWLDSDVPAEHLDDLLVEFHDGAWLLPCRAGSTTEVSSSTDDTSGPSRNERWLQLGNWLHDWAVTRHGDVIVDAGTGEPPEVLLAAADRRLLVTRPCYLSVRRAGRSPARPTGIVLIHEPGRALAPRDIEHAVGAPIVATIRLDPAVARAVDAGLLANRLPRGTARELRRVAA